MRLQYLLQLGSKLSYYVTYLFVEVAYPLRKLPGVWDGGREKDIVYVVRKQDNCLLPNHASFCEMKSKKTSTRMGFEPTRAEHNGLAVHRLNHSATLSYTSVAVQRETLQ